MSHSYVADQPAHAVQYAHAAPPYGRMTLRYTSETARTSLGHPTTVGGRYTALRQRYCRPAAPNMSSPRWSYSLVRLLHPPTCPFPPLWPYLKEATVVPTQGDCTGVSLCLGAMTDGSAHRNNLSTSYYVPMCGKHSVPGGQ
jgi:hypothetical protein